MEQITFIYLVELKDNKIYIGKTKNIIQRKAAHKKTFGNYIKFIILEEIHSLKKEDWIPLECKWIQHYKDLGYDVQNKNKGGGGPEYCSEYVKKIIGDKNRHNKPEGFGNKISRALKGKKLIRKKYILSKEHIEKIKKANSKPNDEETKRKISEGLLKGGNKIISRKKKEWFLYNKHPLIKQVMQIDPSTNNIVKIWNSRKEAIDAGYKGIIYALSKNNHIYKKYIWKYK